MSRCAGVTFEVCPTSEIHTGAASSWARHPMKRMLKAGLRVTLNTDDPSVSEITLAGELRDCMRAGLSGDDIKKAAVWAAEAAFLPRARRDALKKTIERSA